MDRSTLTASTSASNSTSRRRLLQALAAGVWVAASAPPTVAAEPPAANLALEWRLVPWPPAPVPALPAGTVTVGTAGAATAAPAGSVTVQTTPAAEPMSRLLLRNGGQAQILLSRDDTVAPPAWVWTAQGGQGLQAAPRRLARRESLWVRVQWPGGRAPAQLAFRFAQPLPDAADGVARGDAAQQLDGELLLPLGAWQAVGHWQRPDGTGQALQLRLTRLP
jgi:hypothetical protein